MQHLVWHILCVGCMLVSPALGSECQEVSMATMCANYGYRRAWFPNILNDESAEQAGLEMHQFFPLVKVECSPSLGQYLCLTYFPPCQQDDTEIILPCRELCTSARTGCEPLMNRFGFPWPTALSCDNLPAIADGAPCRNTTDGPPIAGNREASTTNPADDDGGRADTTAQAQQSATSCDSDDQTPAGTPAADADSQQLQRTLQKLEQSAAALISFLEKAERLIPQIDQYLTIQNRVLRRTHGYG